MKELMDSDLIQAINEALAGRGFVSRFYLPGDATHRNLILLGPTEFTC